jgi:HSP20 family protein
MSQDDKETLDEIQRAQAYRMQTHVDRLFNDVMPTIRWLSGGGRQKAWRPPTDVYETDKDVIVKVEIAGMSEEDFTISLSNRSLRISGVRHDPDYKRAYQQLEIPYGHFCTEVFLPYAVAYEDIHATYEGGFLTVVLPKAKTHHVRVKDGDASEPTAE